MPIFLANGTRQTMRFNCRIPEIRKLFTFEIDSGRQFQIDKELSLSPEQISSVVEQMERFGFKNVTDLSRKLSDFDGVIFSLNKSIKQDDIRTANEALIDKQERRSASEATKSALGFDKGTRDKKTGRRLASVTAVEVVQDVGSREKPTGKEIKMNLQVSVDGSDNPNIT